MRYFSAVIIEHKQYDLFGEMIFERAILTPPFKKPNPMNNEACFLYVLEGESWFFSETDKIRTPAKESVLLKCGNYVTQMKGADNGNRYEAIAVHFHPEVLKRIYDHEIPKILLQSQSTYSGASMGKMGNNILIQKYIDGLIFYFENPELVNNEILILKLKEIILLLIQSSSAPLIYQILSNLFSPVTHNFKEIVEAHMLSNLTIAELSELTHHSLSSFKREFKKIYQDTPARYIRNRKLERATDLLLISDQRIGDISFECGFSDIAHFSSAFRDKYGISPLQFRMNRKNKSLN